MEAEPLVEFLGLGTEPAFDRLAVEQYLTAACAERKRLQAAVDAARARKAELADRVPAAQALDDHLATLVLHAQETLHAKRSQQRSEIERMLAVADAEANARIKAAEIEVGLLLSATEQLHMQEELPHTDVIDLSATDIHAAEAPGPVH